MWPLLAAGVVLAWRRRQPRTDVAPQPERSSYLGWALVAAAILALLLVAISFVESAAAYPHGGWDAWAIWNLRAKFVTTSETWRNSVSPLVTDTHTEYPLLTSAAIARMWVYEGEVSTSAPAVFAALMGAGLVAFVFGRLWQLRSIALAAAGVLVLFCWLPLSDEAVMQYADVPLACMIVCATGLLMGNGSGETVLAGLIAGLAALTKNEGLAFSILATSAVLVLRRRRQYILPFALAVAPLLVLAFLFRSAIAPRQDPLLQQGAGAILAKVGDFSRYAVLAKGVVSETGGASDWYTHPLLLLAVLAAGLGMQKSRAREVLVPGATIVALFLAGMAAFLLTSNDLSWQIGTAMGRVLTQLWPAALMIIAMMFGPVPAYASVAVETSSRAGKPPRGRKRPHRT